MSIVNNNSNEIVSKIKGVLELNGMMVGELVIKTVIDEYINSKKEILSRGDSVNEIGLGEHKPAFRRVSEKFSSRKFTSRVSVELDKEFKEVLNTKLITDELYAIKVNGESIYQENRGE